MEKETTQNEADLYREEYSLSNECYSYNKECNLEMASFTCYQEE